MKYSLLKKKKSGRPKQYEQIEKIQYKKNDFQEMLDLCFAKQLINEVQFKAGWHYRWLYSLRYNLPLPKISNSYGPLFSDDKLQNLNHEELEDKYKNSVYALQKEYLLYITNNICIYNIYPQFLKITTATMQNIKLSEDITKLQNGLTVLSKLYGFKPSIL